MTQRNLLTEKTVFNVQPRNEPFYLFDGDGLMLKVNPDGSKEWWAEFIIYIGNNAETYRDQNIIGYYPELNLDEARATKERYFSVFNNHIATAEDGTLYHYINGQAITIGLSEDATDVFIDDLLAKTFKPITVKELFNQVDNISKEDFLTDMEIPKNSLIIERMKKEFLYKYDIKADELDQCKLIPVHQ